MNIMVDWFWFWFFVFMMAGPYCLHLHLETKRANANNDPDIFLMKPIITGFVSTIIGLLIVYFFAK